MLPRSLHRSTRLVQRLAQLQPRRAAAIVATLVIAVVITTFAAPSAVEAQPPVERYPVLGRVKGDRVNIRAGASKNHRVVTKLSLASEIIVTGRKGDWLSFHLPPYTTCWIHGDYIRPTQASGQVAVSGNSVNLRPTPDTTFSVIGQVAHNVLLKTTGRRNEDGRWVEIFSPMEATGYIHRDFVEPVRDITLQEAPLLFAKLKPGRLQPVIDSGKPEPASAEAGPKTTQESTAPAMPSVVSERLRAIYTTWLAELKKPPITWSFSEILSDLGQIVRDSEDSGEVKLASHWVQHIQKYHLPIVRGLVEDERKRKLAREQREAGERKEKSAPEAITNRPKVGGKYLAKGWVFAMGKNSKVKGTHKLMKGNKLLFYLNSDSLDLDKYVYKRIGVQGILENLPKDAGARLIRVTSVEVLSR